MAKIFIAGLNPAWQQVFTMPPLRLDAVNRAQAYAELASGKGMNVAKILAARGHDVTLWQVLAGREAGENGQRLEVACQRSGIRSVHAYTAGHTRICATLLHDGGATEVIAPFSVAHDATLADRLLAALPHERFDALLTCGTVPAGLDDTVLAVAQARLSPALTIWDSVAGVTPDLLSRVDWLKVNAEEYRMLAPSWTAPGSAARAPSLLITDGARPALVAPRGEAPVACAVPRLEGVVNPIGAGDTVTAMLADGLLRGLDARAASAQALAAAAASCLHVLPAVWDEAEAARVEAGLQWLDPGPDAPLASAGRAPRPEHRGSRA